MYWRSSLIESSALPNVTTGTLFPQVPTPVRVRTDLGPIGKGASRGRVVIAENGEEYLIKGPSLTPDHPTVGANEWIAVRLAAMLGLPVQDHVIAAKGDNLFFGSRFMPDTSFFPALTETILKQCENRERTYDVVVFDVWLINPDRHEENLIARRVKGSKAHALMLNDHSHLLVNPLGPATVDQLMGKVSASARPYVRQSCISASIEDPARLDAALNRVEGLSEGEIRSTVATTPPELLSSAAQDTCADFLVERRARLRASVEKDSASIFENLAKRP